MPVFTCKDCKKSVSTDASFCPHCGKDFREVSHDLPLFQTGDLKLVALAEAVVFIKLAALIHFIVQKFFLHFIIEFVYGQIKIRLKQFVKI